MVALSRRTFIKASAATGGVLAASKFLVDTVDTVAQANAIAQAPFEDRVFTTCWIGKQDCGMTARRIDGRVVKFEGMAGHPRNDGAGSTAR